jgi:hypothetical protein
MIYLAYNFKNVFNKYIFKIAPKGDLISPVYLAGHFL